VRRRGPHERQLARLVGELEDVDAVGRGLRVAIAKHRHHVRRAAPLPLLVRLHDDALQPAQACTLADRVVRARLVALIPQLEGGVATKLVYPLTVTGAVEWSEAPGSKKTDIDFRFDGPLAAQPNPAPKQTAPLPLPTSKPPDTKKPDGLQPTGVQPANPGVVPK